MDCSDIRILILNIIFCPSLCSVGESTEGTCQFLTSSSYRSYIPNPGAVSGAESTELSSHVRVLQRSLASFSPNEIWLIVEIPLMLKNCSKKGLERYGSHFAKYQEI